MNTVIVPPGLNHCGLPIIIEEIFEKVKQEGFNEGDFMMLELIPNSDLSNYVINLFEMLDGQGISISRMFAVYSQVLVDAFSIHLKKEWKKSNDPTFQKQTNFDEDKEYVKRKFDKLASSYRWNDNKPVNIIPMIHGTDFSVSKKNL